VKKAELSEIISQEIASELAAGLETLKIKTSAEQRSQLLQYLQLLNKWNASFNLSGVTEINDMVSLHLLDSLALSPYLQGQYFVDAGTGAGLPGIPLAILHPEKHFTLIDSNGKKTRFLFQVKLALNLSNVDIENCRIEHYQSPLQIDMVMCRAFSSLEDTVSKTQQLLAKGCKLLAMKGRFPEQEITRLPYPFVVMATAKLEIPGSDSQRHVLEIGLVDKPPQ